MVNSENFQDHNESKTKRGTNNDNILRGGNNTYMKHIREQLSRMGNLKRVIRR